MRESNPRDIIRHNRRKIKNAIPSLPGTAYIFLLPFFILFAVFLAFPILYTFYLSFFAYQGVATDPFLAIDVGIVTITIPSIANLSFVGLDNYRRALSDRVFHQALFNTAYIFVVQVPIMVAFALGLAIALNSQFVRFKRWLRSIMIIPVAANIVAYSVVFLVIVQQGGLADYLFRMAGINPVAWLGNGFWARNLIAFMSVWRWTGYNMIIILAGLQIIPEHLYEAAEMDGANKLHKFWYITIPQLKPVLLFVFITSTIGVFKKFAEPVTLINSGAPALETQTVIVYVYEVAFVNFNLGYGSALTYIVILIITILSIIQTRWA